MTENKRLSYQPWYEIEEPLTNRSFGHYSAETANRLLLEMEERLAGVPEIGGMGYKSQTEDIERFFMNLSILNNYVETLPSNIDEQIDQPLYIKFNHEATEGISRIKLSDLKTDNIVDLKETMITTVENFSGSLERSKKYLTFADFLGTNIGEEKTTKYSRDSGTVTITIRQTKCIESFSNLFKAQYQELVNQGMDSQEVSLETYLEHLLVKGEFDHKMDKPFLNFISTLADATIIVPIISAIMGEDIITGEDLSDAEIAGKLGDALLSLVAIAIAIPSGGGSITARGVLSKVLQVMFVDAAGRGAGYLAKEADFPIWAQTAIRMGVSIVVYKGTNGFFAKLGGQEIAISSELAEQLGSVDEGTGGGNVKTIKTQPAAEANKTFPKGYEPPYKPGTQTKVVEITQNTKTGEYVRVYDSSSSTQAGGWVMKADDIKGLTPQQIQNKYALPTTPTHVTDVNFKAETQLRTGTANSAFGFEGGGIQFDTMGQRVGEFTNGRPLQ